MRVLGLALYGPLAASTRYRLLQYAPGLLAQGIELDVHGLLGDRYLQRRFAGSRLPFATMIGSGLRRFGQLLRQRRYDAAIVHCEVFPFLPGAIERSLLRIPYLYDFDDAFYLKYRSGRMRRLAPLLGGKFAHVIAGAARVTAGNRVLADYAAMLNPSVTLLPTVVDTDRYTPQVHARDDVFTIGWIGSPSTAPFLAELVEPLSILGRESRMRLIVIGGRAPAIDGVDTVEVPWSEDTEVALINSFDVGVMPLPDDDWSRGKCAFKLIQYMACGVPVVASPVGANCDVVSEDNGLFATDTQQWLAALRKLRDDPALRARLGAGARDRVVKRYSLARNLPLMVDAVASLRNRS